MPEYYTSGAQISARAPITSHVKTGARARGGPGTKFEQGPSSSSPFGKLTKLRKYMHGLDHFLEQTDSAINLRMCKTAKGVGMERNSV